MAPSELMETQIDKLRDMLSSMESDLAFDRSKLDRILTEIEALKARVKSIEERMPRTESKMQDALERTLEPLSRAMRKLPKNKSDRQPYLKRFIEGVKKKWPKK